MLQIAEGAQSEMRGFYSSPQAWLAMCNPALMIASSALAASSRQALNTS